MFAVTGITGQVGGAVARALLSAGRPVRGIVRNAGKGALWTEQGCQIAVADIADASAMTDALKGAEAAFLMVPPVFDPAPGFPEAGAVASALATAIRSARPERVVYLSTIGAQSERTNLLSQHMIIENALRAVDGPVTFLRPGWFMENSAWDVAPARDKGAIPSFLYPLDKTFPMIATADIGSLAAELMQERWTGHRIVELEGPRRLSSNDIAAAFAEILGKPVQAEVVPHDQWEELFRQQGMKNPEPRIQMLDGFNEGWIKFEFPGQVRKGATDFETVLRSLVSRD
jgi:NAD(P)H dehydrogenase (quinone)